MYLPYPNDLFGNLLYLIPVRQLFWHSLLESIILAFIIRINPKAKKHFRHSLKSLFAQKTNNLNYHKNQGEKPNSRRLIQKLESHNAF